MKLNYLKVFHPCTVAYASGGRMARVHSISDAGVLDITK